MEHEIRNKIINYCRDLYSKGLLYAADGNISYRLSNDTILITPTGVPKAKIQTSDLSIVDMDGSVISGAPSSEKWMHIEVYKNAPKAKTVIHAHPPTAIAWTIAKPELKELPSEAISEVILAVGSIPIVPFALPGSLDMGLRLHPFLPQHRVMILSRHGALSWGESLQEAYNGMERIENSAQILKIAQELGGITLLPNETVNELKKLRNKIGEKSL